MKERGVFLYHDPDGAVCVSFERGGKGVPVERLLPPSGRGEGFAKFNITAYFDLAGVVLASAKEWAELGRNTDTKDATKDKPSKITPPAPNLDFLKLRSPSGGMDADRAAELFNVVAAYWHSKDDLALEPGLVAQAWRDGMMPDRILLLIRQNTKPDGTLSDPKLADAVQAAQKRLRKKRKQGRLNRKRGRR